ncbi:rho GTPase-activating protein-like protein [Euroglyphus maynei]|uniref:Rho GTPase-activating protein-like protein n=1 Tax=Euroglyphus maynei TaxID=6958 RepID=A0A1Y3BP82_EURMA|nr:rho GTPase-activating protein-like protein [Euroglyphus maynei]
MDGVYISRIALESPVYQSGCLRVGDEVLAINFVDVSRMSLDDVVLIMSIPRRLILTIRSRPLNAEHMLTNRSIYGTGMSDSCYYDTVAGDIYSRVDDLHSKPVVIVKQKQPTEASLMLDEDEEEDVFQAASAAAEAGLLDDPSTAAAAAVAALQDPTPAKAAAAVAAVNEIMVRSGSSLELYGSNAGSRPGSSLMMAARSHRNRRLFTSDNLADLYQSEVERAVYVSGNRRGTLASGSLVNQKRTPLSSLYHGRLAHHGSRSRSATGRLMRTSSEQMLYGDLQKDPVEQIDHFLQRYQSLKQMQRGHRPSTRTRHHSLDHSAMLRNSYSTQSLTGSNYPGISHHGMAIPLPGMAEAVAIARRRYLRGETNTDTSGNLFDGSYSDTEQQQYGAMVDHSNRSNSLPRAPGLSGRHHGHHRASSSLSNRLQQLEQLYSSAKSHGPRSLARPHSAMADNYDTKDIAEDYSTAEMLARMRRNFATGQNRFSGQESGVASQLMPSTRLDSLRASLAESSSSEDVLAKNRSSSRTAASTSAIYETIRKSKMAQDLQQPQSGRLMGAAASGSTTDDMKSRFSSLQISRHSSDTHGLHRPPYDEMLDSQIQQQQQQQASSATTSLIGQISTRPSRILMIDPSGFQQYGPDLHRQTTMATIGTGGKNDGQIAGYSGLLVIHLLGVRGLQFDHLIAANKSITSTTTTTKRVLYSVVECDRIYKARTVAVQSHENNSSNFDWDEVFDIDLFDTKEVSFLFYTWDQSLPDLNMRHKQCSKGTIHLPSITSLTTQHVHAFELRLYDTPGAMFYIKLEYHDLTTTFKRTKRDHHKGVRTNRTSTTIGEQQPLFGVDLETVISRESSGFSIPIIIKRCCEEIEQRGLHMLGIYRLCGSSLVKRTLRESFERNAWLADISAENVPDINVVTSE